MEYTRISEGINKDSFRDNIFGIGSHYSHHEDENESNVLDRLLTDEISANNKFTNNNGAEVISVHIGGKS